MSGLQIAFTGLKKQYNNLRQEILDATDEVLRSGQLMDGNATAEFENWLARRNHSKYAVTVHSGTAALECLAEYYATGSSVMPPRVLIPTVTYAATANAFQFGCAWKQCAVSKKRSDYPALVGKRNVGGKRAISRFCQRFRTRP